MPVCYEIALRVFNFGQKHAFFLTARRGVNQRQSMEMGMAVNDIQICVLVGLIFASLNDKLLSEVMIARNDQT